MIVVFSPAAGVIELYAPVVSSPLKYPIPAMATIATAATAVSDVLFIVFSP